MEWKVYYGDGSTFSDQDGVPEDAPAWNVQAIVQPHIESGRYVICLYDYYIFRDGKWFGVDQIGAVDYLLHSAKLGKQNPDGTLSLLELPKEKIASIDFILFGAIRGLVKIGRMLRKEQFRKIHQLADSDPDFPKRTAFRANERRV